MSHKRLTGRDINVMLHGFLIEFNNVSLSIEDNRSIKTTRGVPNGWLDGSVAASGELELDSMNFDLIIEAARIAGGFKALEPVDIVLGAASRGGAIAVTAHDCLLKVTDLINADSEGGEELMHKIEFVVCGKDFVSINGVPYLDNAEASRLLF